MRVPCVWNGLTANTNPNPMRRVASDGLLIVCCAQNNMFSYYPKTESAVWQKNIINHFGDRTGLASCQKEKTLGIQVLPQIHSLPSPVSSTCIPDTVAEDLSIALLTKDCCSSSLQRLLGTLAYIVESRACSNYDNLVSLVTAD